MILIIIDTSVLYSSKKTWKKNPNKHSTNNPTQVSSTLIGCPIHIVLCYIQAKKNPSKL